MREFFTAERIEYYATLPWSDGYVSNFEKWERIRGGREVFAVTVFLIPYFCENASEIRNISRYACAGDYHEYFALLAKRANVRFGETVCGLCDNSPLFERKIASDGGLGVWGENGLIINEKYGSYVFIGIFVHFAPTKTVPPSPRRACLGCGACTRACPAGCLGGSVTGCLSHLTQKKKRTEAENEAVLRGNLLWGCDVCQEACPLNHSIAQTPISYFRIDLISWLNSEVLDGLVAENKLSKRAFGWRGEQHLRENLALWEKKKK